MQKALARDKALRTEQSQPESRVYSAKSGDSDHVHPHERQHDRDTCPRPSHVEHGQSITSQYNRYIAHSEALGHSPTDVSYDWETSPHQAFLVSNPTIGFTPSPFESQIQVSYPVLESYNSITQSSRNPTCFPSLPPTHPVSGTVPYIASVPLLAPRLGAGHRIPSETGAHSSLRILQQPDRARMCGFGDKDWRPIEPPPIVEHVETDPERSPIQPVLFVVRCMLWNEDGTQERTLITTSNADYSTEEMNFHPMEKHTRNLLGQITANATPFKDEHGETRFIYLFSNLYIRLAGRYRLEFHLICLDLSPGITSTGSSRIVTKCRSEVFEVYPAKQFPCMMESTELTRAIWRQGFKVTIRNKMRNKKDIGDGENKGSLISD